MKNDYLKILKNLASFPSGTYRKEDVNNASDFLLEKYHKLGFRSHKYSHEKFGNMVYVSATGDINKDSKDKKRLLLVGHIDTVYNNTQKPKIFETEDGKLFGPGVCDMKGGDVVILATVEQLIEKGVDISKLGVLIVSEEEQMHPDNFPEMADIAKAYTHAMVYESQELGWFDPKLLPIVAERKGAYAIKVKISGPGGHSGLVKRKKDNHNVIHTFMQMGQELVGLAKFAKGTTTNLGTVTGGTAVNALAKDLEFGISVRFATLEEYDRIRTEFLRILMKYQSEQIKVEVTETNVIPPMPYTDNGREFLKLVKKSLKKIGINGKYEYRGSGSDAGRLMYFNPKIAVLDHFGVVGGGEHIENEEFIFVKSLDWAIKNSEVVVRSTLESFK